MQERTYIAIDLKSFYASVECVDRGLDAMTTNLVVADLSRTEKTICLAVTPSLKAYGIPGRARLFEVIQKVKQVNRDRQRHAPQGKLTGKGEEVVEYKLGDAITEVGDYTLTITDALGNKVEMSFTIVQPLVQKFEHNFDETPGFEKVLVNGEEKRLNYGTLELLEDGTYEVGVVT